MTVIVVVVVVVVFVAVDRSFVRSFVGRSLVVAKFLVPKSQLFGGSLVRWFVGSLTVKRRDGLKSIGCLSMSCER